MKIRSLSVFNYTFRAPGSPVEGPVRFAVGQVTLGMLLIGRSQRGICAILLGDDAQTLRHELAETFPNVELLLDQSSLQRELDQIIVFIDKGTTAGVINLDIGGTAFEQKVWQALCGIPAGQTRSYGEVAQDLGTPEAARAVAGACAANVLAIAIPCHRVVRGDGSVSGYRWGAERKLALLAGERSE
jgi:AraC family transcriptional regulator, regulatory protein of adaptative response / methylated-DNA-[protein]-cysteine methyltransferase